MGAGPEALVRAGLAARLEARGHRVRTTVVEPPADAWTAEIRTAFDLAAALAEAVRAARAAGRVPLILSGNCGPAALGACAGLGAATRVVWLDAHADLNTPETTVGGFLDGMGLATLTGRCWTALAAARLPALVPVPDDRVWLVGARDLDPGEAAALDRSAIRRLPAGAVDGAAGERLAAVLAGPAPWYLHLDLDVHDPSEGRANGYAAPGGATAAGLAAFCAALGRDAFPSAVALTAYDPATDADGRVAEAARRAVGALFGDG
jgi:arginase